MNPIASSSTIALLDPFVPPAIPRIRTPRLLLREPRRSDFPGFAENLADPLAQAFIGGPRSPRDAWRNFVSSAGYWALGGMGWWMVEEPAIGPIGTVGVFVRESSPEVEIGWTIYRAHWGKGFASEAARAALDFTVQRHGVRRIIAHVDKANERSLKVAVKIGMRWEKEADFYGETVSLYSIGVGDGPNPLSQEPASSA
jgi:RimJ/RimL family protein N-acetyltransferase